MHSYSVKRCQRETTYTAQPQRWKRPWERAAIDLPRRSSSCHLFVACSSVRWSWLIANWAAYAWWFETIETVYRHPDHLLYLDSFRASTNQWDQQMMSTEHNWSPGPLLAIFEARGMWDSTPPTKRTWSIITIIAFKGQVGWNFQVCERLNLPFSLNFRLKTAFSTLHQ